MNSTLTRIAGWRGVDFGDPTPKSVEKRFFFHHIVRLGFLGLLLWTSALQAAQVELSVAPTNSAIRARLDWQAVPSQTYLVQTTTNLSASSWTNMMPDGVTASNVIGSFESVVTNGTRFFRIVKVDTDAPTVPSLFPDAAAIAVVTNATVTITFDDETGIDTNSLVLNIGPWLSMASGSAGVVWSSNTVTFSPPGALGGAGAMISNSLSVADTLGHTLSNFTWTFQLARPSVATSAFLPLTAPPASGLQAMANVTMLRRSLPNVQPLDGNNEYHIVSATSNTLIFSYSSGIPIISNGTILVSFDAAYPFYRSVVSNTLNESQKQITAWTVDISLTNLVSEGSLASINFAPAKLSGGYQPLMSYSGNLPVVFNNDLSGKVLYEEAGLKLWFPAASCGLVGGVDIAFDIAGGKLQSLDTSVTGKLTLNATAQAIFTVALEGGASVPLMPPVTKVFGGMVWAVPVWVQVKMELEAGYAYNADASGSIQTTVAMEKDLSFHVNLRNDQWTSGGENPAIVRSAEPLSWQLEGTANVNVNIQPKLTVLVYSLAGLWVDINPYLEFDGSYQANPLAYDLGVYGGLSSTLGVACEIPGITTPEPWTLFDQRWLLWSNSNQNDVKPAFVADFRNQTVARSKSFALSAAVSGSPAPQYKWLFNGGRIPGETSSWYAIASAQPGHAGTYTVQAYNSAGSAEASCQVSVTDAEPVPQTDFDLPLRATHGTLNQTQPFGDFFPEMFGFHSAEDWKYVNVTADNQYVYSAGPGRVVWISDWSDTRGKVVAIEHTGTFAIPRKDYVCPTTGQTYTCPTATLTKVMSVYVHLTNVQVYSNQIVNVNTLLGKYMNAGTGPHLHFEIRLPGTIPSASWSMFQPQSNWYTYLDPADATYKYTGYYLNLQQMVDAGVDAGVREPLSFIYANSHRAVSTKFTVGQAINAPDAVNVRILPSYLVWEGIKSVSANTTGVILDASATGFKNGVAADGYSWWYVQFGAVSGWCAEACLKTTVPVDPAPSGMVLIPAGTNTGTDPDFGAYSLTVAAFYMDATEVTKAKWDEVYTWALAHGYTFAHAGSGKAANHPVQTVSWYDCVKWCNARSEKEGKTPCYNLSTWACNFAANGYRLPTNTEWEYAARGGLSSKRFPWGDIIDHTRANYHAYWSGGAPYFAYDQGYQGYDTRYATGGEPYTSPAGAFAASGYGLYDMAGNVWEWCNDSSGLSRYVRGGSWNSRANYARCGYSNSWYGPGSAFSTYGFRTVCR